MFKSKQKIIKELKKELADKEAQISELQVSLLKKEDELTNTQKELLFTQQQRDKYKALDDATPSDCTRGTWCAACEFAKEYDIYHGRIHEIVHFCGKAESCSNFVQKEK